MAGGKNKSKKVKSRARHSAKNIKARRRIAATRTPHERSRNVDQRLELAIRRHRAGQFKEAEAVFTGILEHEPQNSVALHFLGLAVHETGDDERAASLIGEAVSADPGYAAAHANLGAVLQKLRRLDDAMASYERALAIDPGNAQTIFNFGVALQGSGRLTDAASRFRRVLEINPNFIDANIFLADVLWNLGRLDDAAANYRKARAIRPADAQLHINLVYVLLAQEKFQDVIQLGDPIDTAGLNMDLLHFYLGVAHDLLGLTAGAEARFSKFVAGGENFMMTSWNYAKSHAPRHSMLFASRFDFLEYALSHAKTAGMILEFGVYRGDSVNFIAGKTVGMVHGFDSFEGLPEDWEHIEAGGFSTQGTLPDVRDNVRLHAGWFDDTLPPFVAEYEEPIRLMNVDCDLYSSTQTIFEFMGDRVIRGSVIVFDEYFMTPNWRIHEFKAFQEAVRSHDWRYEYLAFNLTTSQVALKII